MKYVVHVTIIGRDLEAKQQEFDYWCDACAWIENLANNDYTPEQVFMRMELVND